MILVPPSSLALCLDVDATLIVNVLNPIPRPGLNGFLRQVTKRCPFVALYSAASCNAIDEAFAHLIIQKVLDPRFFVLPKIVWSRRGVKDLRRVWQQYPQTQSLWPVLIDDLPPFIAPTQRAQHIPVAPYNGDPYDTELQRILDGPLTQGVLAPTA